VKEWLKSVLHYRSHPPKKNNGYLFLDHPVCIINNTVKMCNSVLYGAIRPIEPKLHRLFCHLQCFCIAL